MDEKLTADQFLENMKAWKPEPDLRAKVEARLRSGKAPEALIGDLAGAFQSCAESTYAYIQYINELAAIQQLDKGNFIAQVARLVGLVEALRESGKQFERVFQRYDAAVRPALNRDRFDTVYFDAIQDIDLGGLLKKVIEEVEVVLQSFSLVTADLSGVQCADLYFNSIRSHLYLRYFLDRKGPSVEELWSILFDINNQLAEVREVSVAPSEEQLKDLQSKIQNYKHN